MSIEDGKDYRNWLRGDPELLARNKERKRMLKFKIRVFKTALYNEQKAYEKLLKGVERREKAYKPNFKDRETLDASYVAGLVSDDDYPRERYAIWQCYSDRGHINNMKWIESELAKYEKALADFQELLDNHSRENTRAREKRRRRHHRHMAYKRRKRREKKRAYKEELRERYKYYGLR